MMRAARLGLVAAAMALALPLAHAQQAGGGSVPAQASVVPLDKRKMSYAIGYQFGSQFVEGGPDVDIQVLIRALQDGYAKRNPTVSQQDMRDQLISLGVYQRTQAQNEFRRIAQLNARKSADFMAHNGAQPGVVQLPSGIQYSIIHSGAADGPSPGVSSQVVANYSGKLIDGTEFDSTWARGRPVRFFVNKVIPGWQDVIPRMHVGDRWKVIIPPQLAYGENGALPRIGPNEALIFDIELLGIESP